MGNPFKKYAGVVPMGNANGTAKELAATETGELKVGGAVLEAILEELGGTIAPKSDNVIPVELSATPFEETAVVFDQAYAGVSVYNQPYPGLADNEQRNTANILVCFEGTEFALIEPGGVLEASKASSGVTIKSPRASAVCKVLGAVEEGN